jgi:hypothetical protein
MVHGDAGVGVVVDGKDTDVDALRGSCRTWIPAFAGMTIKQHPPYWIPAFADMTITQHRASWIPAFA